MAKQSTHEPLTYFDTVAGLATPQSQKVTSGTDKKDLGSSTVHEQVIVAQPGFYENHTKGVKFYDGDPLDSNKIEG